MNDLQKFFIYLEKTQDYRVKNMSRSELAEWMVEFDKITKKLKNSNINLKNIRLVIRNEN